MKSRLKVLSYYLVMIILSILVLGFSLVTLAKFTVFNEDYFINQLKKNDYYENLYQSISEEMSYYIIQSGLEDSVLSNIYTKEMVTDEINGVVDSFYHGKKIKVDTSVVKNNLENNIKDYLLKNNIVVSDQASLDQFVDHMLDIYNEEIILSKYVEKLQGPFVKLSKLLDMLFIALIIVIAISSIGFRIFYKRTILTIPTISSATLLLLGRYLFFNRIDVKNILFWTDNVSNVIKSILWSISKFVCNEAIVLIIIGVVAFIISYLGSRKRIVKKKDVELL